MIFSKIQIFRKRKRFPFGKESSRGAITVEYAFTMVIAAALMIGVELMFRRLATDVIARFKDIVSMFPNI
jgi:Flp pilus assembly pilin Flp